MKPKKICIEVSTEVADYIAEGVKRIESYIGIVATDGVQPWEACNEFLIAYKKAKEVSK